MIELSKVDIYGWEASIRGMRNPLNSWSKSDSYWSYDGEKPQFIVGEADLKLMRNLSDAGNDHGKFLRFINVTLDINAPLYWWKEFDTYKVGTVANSCSTMHKLHSRDLTREDFSHESLDEFCLNVLNLTINNINHNRRMFLNTGNKTYWECMVQLLPSSYNQLRTVQLNYCVLKAMYHARRNHKLEEWREFCRWIETLPYAKELITNAVN